MTGFASLPDVACRTFGGSVVWADDDFFGARECLVLPGAATHDPAAFGPRGKVYDGWETRRRRTPGDDAAIVRLGRPALVEGVVVDTAYFLGNYPPRVSVETAEVPGDPSPEELREAAWTRVLDRVEVRGGTANGFPTPPTRASHVRLLLHPDGGVARLRVHGRPDPDPEDGLVDLAARDAGGAVVGCSDMFYGSAANLLLPGRAVSVADGWENARRRSGGNDHVVVRLGRPGRARLVVVDTSCFIGNAPVSVRVRGTDGDAALDLDRWVDLVPRTDVRPDHRRVVEVPPEAAAVELRHVRLDVYPDGGVARLRVLADPVA